jgi:hypothetical protein
MKDTKRMLKSRVQDAGLDEIGERELPYPPQSLEDRRRRLLP